MKQKKNEFTVIHIKETQYKYKIKLEEYEIISN